MNLKNTMLRTATVMAVVLSFVGCEDDFETVGTDVIGQPGFNADLYDDAELEAWTNNLGPVQTNNLPVNLLGYYDDPVFGEQTASILTQVYLSQLNPDFGVEPVLDSVVFHVPYFSSEVESEDEEVMYELDSVYGNEPIKLKIQESSFFLNNFDPDTDFQQAQKYYSNMAPVIESNLTSSILFEDESFLPSPEQIVVYPIGESEVVDEGDEGDTLHMAPALRVHLEKDFFQNRILDAQGSSHFSSHNNFRNYLRSLYIKAEKTGDEGNLMMLNLTDEEAGIILYYSFKGPDIQDDDGDGDEDELIEKQASFKLNFGPTRVNTFEQEVDFPTDDHLFLRGGEGSMAVIELFSGPDADGDGDSDELEFLRDSDWLINEANLEFYVNQEYMQGLNEPERVYLYDLKNNLMLADYAFAEPGKPNELTNTSNEGHLVPLERDEDKNGIKYKVRITRHINNVLNKDSTNVKLGLVVSQNVNLISNSAVLPTEGGEVQKVPVSSVISPEGTVLYGPEAEDADKRLKLKIYYTEPKE